MARYAEQKARPQQSDGKSRGEEPRFDVKSHVAQALIEAMEKGETPWQRPWNAQSMRPVSAD